MHHERTRRASRFCCCCLFFIAACLANWTDQIVIVAGSSQQQHKKACTDMHTHVRKCNVSWGGSLSLSRSIFVSLLPYAICRSLLGCASCLLLCKQKQTRRRKRWRRRRLLVKFLRLVLRRHKQYTYTHTNMSMLLRVFPNGVCLATGTHITSNLSAISGWGFETRFPALTSWMSVAIFEIIQLAATNHTLTNYHLCLPFPIQFDRQDCSLFRFPIEKWPRKKTVTKRCIPK